MPSSCKLVTDVEDRMTLWQFVAICNGKAAFRLGGQDPGGGQVRSRDIRDPDRLDGRGSATGGRETTFLPERRAPT